MHDAFAPGGALSRALPGFEARSEQAALAAAVERALATGEHLVAEAGTGTGKSLAYLLPALESGQRVVVATATKALQEQLLAKDVPIAARALGRDVRVAVLKGRQNYACRKALHGFGLLGGALMRTAEDAAAFEELRPWLDATETGDRAEGQAQNRFHGCNLQRRRPLELEHRPERSPLVLALPAYHLQHAILHLDPGRERNAHAP